MSLSAASSAGFSGRRRNPLVPPVAPWTKRGGADRLGQPWGSSRLPDAVRGPMEGAFGADFSSVKLHTGHEAESLNNHVGAMAFTVGSDIFLGRSAPSISSPSGQSLLAHELTHTIQQGGARVRPEDGEEQR